MRRAKACNRDWTTRTRKSVMREARAIIEQAVKSIRPLYEWSGQESERDWLDRARKWLGREKVHAAPRRLR